MSFRQYHKKISITLRPCRAKGKPFKWDQTLENIWGYIILIIFFCGTRVLFLILLWVLFLIFKLGSFIPFLLFVTEVLFENTQILPLFEALRNQN